MKSHIDFFETFKGEFLAAKRFRNRFIRFWGTETIDDVKVMKKKFYLYPNTLTDTDIEKMSRLLGSWSQIKEADYSPIKGYYLWLNPNKNITSTEELNAELLAEKVDAYCPKNEWKYATINYIDKTEPTRFDGFTKEQILDYIDSDYRKIFDFDNGFVVGDTIAEETIGKYVLFDDGTEFEVSIISSQVTSIVPTIANGNWWSSVDSRTRYTGLSINIKFKRIVDDISTSGLFITTFLEEQSEYQKKLALSMQISTEEGDETWEIPTITNDIWYKDQLRYSVISSNQIKTKLVTQLILNFIDSGQDKKSVKWYNKVLGLVLIVIAIAVAVFTGGTGAPVSAMLTSIALYVGVTVLVMTLVQAQWAKNNSAAAEYMGRWVKIGNIIGTLAGITSVLQNLGTKLSQEAAKEAATQAIASSSTTTIAQASVTVASMSAAEVAALNTTLGVTANITASTVMAVGKDIVVGYIGSTWQSISMKVAEFAVSMRQRDMKYELQAKIAYAQELADEVEASTDKNMHIGLEDLKRYTNNTDRIWTRYDYDSLYGPEPATMHIGNIQKASSYKGTGLNLRAENLV